MIRLALVALIAACAPHPRYLGAEVPRPCTTRDAEGCLGWMMERDLLAAELGIYDDAALRGYAQGVADRLARVSNLETAPRVMIADHDETYATAGRRIVIARTTIEQLETEAELAGVIGHELAHVEARHVLVSLFGRPESDSAEDRRDAEAIADERAVVLLEQAGYAPRAMASALTAVLAADDDDHPPRAERIARVTALGANRGGFEGRAEFLAHIDRMVIGRDPRLGHRVADTWVVPALELAFELADDDRVLAADEILVVRRGNATILAYAVGTPWAREIAGTFEHVERASSALGMVTRGVMPPRDPRADTPLDKLARAIRNTLPQPSAGTQVVILEPSRAGALVVELGGRGVPELRVRPITAAERAASEPDRIAIEHAPVAARLSVLAPCRGRLLERTDRALAAGDPIKCANRVVAR